VEAPIVPEIKQPPSQTLAVNLSSPLSPPDPPKEEKPNVSPLDVAASVAKGGKPVSADTVNISSEAIKVATDIKKDEPKKTDPKKDAVVGLNKNEQTEKATAGIQFVYNQDGDLITKYLDLSGNIVYQVPSKLMLLMKELSPNSLSLDTKG